MLDKPNNGIAGVKGPAILVRHSHMDTEWLTPFARSLRRYRSALAEVLDLLEADPQERFTLDGVPLLSAALDGHPDDGEVTATSAWHRLYVAGLEAGHGRDPGTGEDLLRRVRARAAAGQLEIVGTFVQPDTNLPAGEALLRHGLEAGRWFEARLGVRPDVAWNMDCFGQSAQLPQILQQCGYRALLAFRGGPVEEPGTSGVPHLEPAFRFSGPDGTELPVWLLPTGYSPGVLRHPRPLAWLSAVCRLPRAARHLDRLAGALPLLVPFGGEFSGALPGIGPTLWQLGRALPDREVRLGTAADLFDALEQHTPDLPRHEGDLNPVYPGTHALRPELKRLDRRVTAELQAAEALTALALAVTDEDRSALEQGWHALLTCQAHDSIGGCHVPAVARDVESRGRRGSTFARGVIERCLAAAARPRLGRRPRAARASDDRAVAVFNPLGHPRTGVARVAWNGPPPAEVIGPDGPLRFAYVARVSGTFLDVVIGLPGLGLGVLRAVGGRAGAWRDEPRSVAHDHLELEGLTVRPRPGGALTLDGPGGQARVAPLLLEQDRGNAYLVRPSRNLGRAEGGTWRATDTALGRAMTWEGSLGRGRARIDLEQVDGRPWLGLRLRGEGIPDDSRVRLPIRARGPARYGVPFGQMDRRGPAAARTWVEPDPGIGVANLGVPSLEIAEGRVDLVLVRAVRMLSHGLPLQRLRIPIRARARTGWRADLALGPDPARTGEELNRPLVGMPLPWRWPVRARPRAEALLEAPGGEGARLVAVKPPFEGIGLVLRVLQERCEPAVVRLHLPGPGDAWRTDATEEGGVALDVEAGHTVEVTLQPWELCTVVWRPRP